MKELEKSWKDKLIIMKYIRTKDGRITTLKNELVNNAGLWVLGGKENILKIADTIEELCDEFVYFINDMPFVTHKGEIHYVAKGIPVVIYGAIWTEWGLKYVAKMNDKGELELL